jgi:hydroxymethylbilane synthase
VNFAVPQSPLRIGTRGSRLALAQASLVREALAARDIASELVTVRTSGDRIQDRPLAALGGKGLFTKELEDALLGRAIDLAVHSMKDVPVLLPEGLQITAILQREDARDAFVSHRAGSLAELPPGARIGTSSVRRQAQVARARPDLEIIPLRGNVDTRITKLDGGEFDAILLACAGLRRLGLHGRATALMPLQTWLPALSQGAIGIETRRHDDWLNFLAPLHHLPTAVALSCERAFQAALDGSCTTPIGGFADYSDGTLSFRGEVIAPDGSGYADTAFNIVLNKPSEEEAGAFGGEAGLTLKPRALQWLPS